MADLIVCTWRWGTKYGWEYVDRLRNAVARNLEEEHEFRVFEPEFGDELLAEMPGCFPRLRMFDPAWQEKYGLTNARILCLDLDLVVTGPLDPLVEIEEPFGILQGANASNPCPYNGSVILLDAGFAPQVWRDFSIEAVRRLPFFEFPDDQGWLAHKVPGAWHWKVGRESGIYAFQKPGWPSGTSLPPGARIVAFPGRRDPAQFTHLHWVQEHWL